MLSIVIALLSLLTLAAAQAAGTQAVTGICGVGNPCQNGACCAVAPGATSGYCGYGPTYCGTSNLTACISNCDAKAACGPNAEAANFSCPLNVCCSQYGFCGTTDEFCGTGCTAGCEAPTNPTTGCALASSLQRVIGYYEGWAIGHPCDVILPEELPVGSYTHLYFSFGSIDPDSFAVVPASPGDVALYTRLTNLKQVNPSLRVYISIGGWSFNDPGATQTTFSDLAASAAHRSAFTASLINFMALYGFDGIDIDWEYPVAPERGGSPGDKENFVQLVADIRAAFNAAGHSNYGITFTSPSSFYYMQNFDIPAMLQYADWVNVMTYDLHGTWDQNDIWIGPYLLAHTNITEMASTLELLWRQDVPAGKVVLGIGFYGRSFTVSDPHCTTPGYACTFSGAGNPGVCTGSAGTLSYAEIMDIIAENNLVGTFDIVSGAKYVTWDTNQWVSYDDAETFELKLNLADQNCLGGVMIWSADQDTLSFDALNGLLGLNTLAIAEERKPMDTILSPNGQNCGPTTNCGDPCPDGTIQVTGNGKAAYVPDGCPSDSPRKICCPIIAVPGTCEWKGSGDCSNGYCSDGEVTVAVSKSGDGSACRGDSGSHKEFCCSTSIPNYLLENVCVWASECTSITCPSNYPIIQTTAQGYPHCESYGLSGHLQPLCCSEDIFKNCAWHGDPSNDCTDNVCPAGQFVLKYDSCGDLGIGNCCPYNMQRLYCCDPPSDTALEAPVPIGDLYDNPPDQNEATLTYRVEILDGSGSTDPNSHAFGSMFLDGDSSDITSVQTLDWVVLDCDSTLEDAQQVRIFCTQDFNTSSCSDLTKGHTLDTIVKMPTTCAKGNYVRVTNFAPAQNQTLSDAYASLKPASESVYDLSFDFALDQIDVTLLSDEIVFRVDTSNIPGYWNSVVNSAPSRRSVGMSKRDLEERWWGAFSDWLRDMTTIDIPIVKRLDVAGPKSFNYPLFNKQISCPALHLTASATVGVSGQVSIPITYGVIIMGSLLPTPDISESYAFLDASATASVTFYAQGQATLTYNSDIVNIFKQSVYGFSYSNIVSIGPTLILDAYIQGQLNLAGNFAAGLTFNSPSYHFAVPDDSTNGNSAPADASMGSNVVPSLSASASASGSVSIHLVPRAQIGIEIGWQGKQAISAVAAVSADTSVTFGFNAQASTSGSSACLYADAGLNLFGGLSGSLAGTDLAGSFNVTFYQSPAYNLFQLPDNCHSSTPIPSERRALPGEEISYGQLPPDFSWDHVLSKRDTPANECPGIINCNSDGTTGGQCTGAQDTDCYPNTCSYDTSSGTVGRRALSLTDHSTYSIDSYRSRSNHTLTSRRVSSNTSSSLGERDTLADSVSLLDERDTITGSGGFRDNVPICGRTWQFSAEPKLDLTWYDYDGDLSDADNVFELGIHTFNPNNGFPYQVGGGNPRFPENQASYYNVEHVYVLADFETYMRANPNQISAANVDAICADVVADSLSFLSSPVTEPGVTSSQTGNLVMAPFGLNSFKFQAFAGNAIPGTSGLDAGTALRRLKYFAALGYYMNDPLVNALWKDTASDVKDGWTTPAGTISAALSTTVGTMYDTWLAGKVAAAENYVTTASSAYITYLQSLPAAQLCYGVTAQDLTDYQNTLNNDLTYNNFNL